MSKLKQIEKHLYIHLYVTTTVHSISMTQLYYLAVYHPFVNTRLIKLIGKILKDFIITVDQFSEICCHCLKFGVYKMLLDFNRITRTCKKGKLKKKKERVIQLQFMYLITYMSIYQVQAWTLWDMLYKTLFTVQLYNEGYFEYICMFNQNTQTHMYACTHTWCMSTFLGT